MKHLVVILLLASSLCGCGGGSSTSVGSSSTSSSPPPVTSSLSVGLDSSVPSSAVSAITTYTTPSGPFAAGTAVSIPILDSSAEAIILASDKSDNILLAGMVGGGISQVKLSAETTAVALVRLAHGPIDSGITDVEFDQSVRATGDFNDLGSGPIN